MNYDSGALFALVLQFGVGFVALYYALIGFIFAVLFSTIFIWTSSTLVFIVVWGILSIVGIVQSYFGYRLYKRIPGAIRTAIIVNVVAVILYGIDIVASVIDNILLPYPEVLLYFGLNVLLVILLNMSSVRNQLESDSDSQQSEYFQF